MSKSGRPLSVDFLQEETSRVNTRKEVKGMRIAEKVEGVERSERLNYLNFLNYLNPTLNIEL
jgi:hypothetical protein